MQESLKELNRSSVLISFWISARVLGWAKRMAISQTILRPSSPQAQSSLLIGKNNTNADRMCLMLLPRYQAIRRAHALRG